MAQPEIIGTQLRQRFGGHWPAAILFDLDGTLVDSVPDLTAAVDRMRQQLGYPCAGEAAVRGWVGNGAAKLVERALNDVGSNEQAAGMQWFKRFYAEENGRTSVLYAGVAETLAQLQSMDIPMAVVTNKPKHFADPLLQALDIAAFFSQVIGGDCLAERKPSGLPIEVCSRRLGVEVASILMVGDSRNDIESARAAGCLSAAVPYGYNYGEPISQSQPDWLLQQFSDLLA